jgi:hypothetical protein
MHLLVLIDESVFQVYDIDLFMPTYHMELMDHLKSFLPERAFMHTHFDAPEAAVQHVTWIITHVATSSNMHPEWSRLCMAFRNSCLVMSEPQLLGLRLLNVPDMNSTQLGTVCKFINDHNQVQTFLFFC